MTITTPVKYRRSSGKVTRAIDSAELGKIGLVATGSVLKLRTAIASRASMTPTEAQTRVSGEALRQRPVDDEVQHEPEHRRVPQRDDDARAAC